jgi:hypothetical protein
MTTTLTDIVSLVEKIQGAKGYFEHYLDCTLDDDALNEIVKELDTPHHVLDWSIYSANDRIFIEGTKCNGNFLPLRPEFTLLARKKDRYCIYILAPTAKDLEAAKTRFSTYAWARPILIPTTFYLESVMYYHILPLRRDEWVHADYVGTLSHTAAQKLTTLDTVTDVLRGASDENAHIAAFMYRGDPLLATAEKWHPGFLHIWAPLLRFHGFPTDKILSESIPSFYANYWAAVPDAMDQYIDFFKKVKISLEVLPSLSETVWKDSEYGARTGIAGLTSDRCLEIWGVPWYPFHPFLFERLPCFFFWVNGGKIFGARL